MSCSITSRQWALPAITGRFDRCRSSPPTNVLYGGNLDILRRYIPDATVDLIYLDPPFNSNRDYVGFRSPHAVQAEPLRGSGI